MSTTRKTTIHLSDPTREVEGFDDYRDALRQLVTNRSEPTRRARTFRRRLRPSATQLTKERTHS